MLSLWYDQLFCMSYVYVVGKSAQIKELGGILGVYIVTDVTGQTSAFSG